MSRALNWLRVLGYVATLAVHASTVVLINKPHAEDHRVLVFKGNRPRYLTVWNVVLQLVHAVLGLICEYLLFKNTSQKSYQLPRLLRLARDKLFTNIVFPGSCVVATVFWLLFTYDRELVFPEFLDDIVPLAANHVIHTFIVLVVLYETLLQPRSVPKTHFWNCLHILVHSAIYSGVVFYTYYEKGQWLYPILGVLSPPFFALFAGSVVGLALVYYFLQWRLVRLVWGDVSEKKKTRKLR